MQDTAFVAGTSDSASVDTAVVLHPFITDSFKLEQAIAWAGFVSPYLADTAKSSRFDVQQRRLVGNPLELLILLILMAVLLVYLRISFFREVSALYEAVFNRNLELQHLRSASGLSGFSNILLTSIHLLVCGIFISILLSRIRYGNNAFLQIPVSFGIILFTSVYLIKSAVINIIGFASSEAGLVNEYLYQMNNMLKTLGVVLLPLMLMLMVSKGILLDAGLLIGSVVTLVLATVYYMRGLSTGVKFMYKSVYHFFIYICVVEILPIILTVKFLTKTVL